MCENRPIGSEIHKTAKNIKSYIDHNITGKVDCGMTGFEGMTMKFLVQKGGSLKTSEIMEYTKLSKATTSETLNSLLKKGLIIMDVSRDDRRVKVVTVTEKGKEVDKQFDIFFEKMNLVLESGFTEEEKTQFREYLTRVRFNLGYEE